MQLFISKNLLNTEKEVGRHRFTYSRSQFFIGRLLGSLLKQPTWEDRRQHAKHLNEQIYNRLLEFRIEERRNHTFVLTMPCDYNQFRVYKQLVLFDRGLKEPPFIEVDRLEYLDLALQHLKHYRKMYKYWQEAQDLLQKHNKNPTNVDEDHDNILRVLDQLSKELAILVSDIKAGQILKGKSRIGY